MRRAKGALEELPGIRNVRFHPGPDRFEVEYQASETNVDELAAAILGTVVTPGIRIALERFGRLLTHPLGRNPTGERPGKLLRESQTDHQERRGT